MLRLYDNHTSGNGYKPRLLLAHLGIAYDHVEIDILNGESRTPAFLAKNPTGRIPVLELARISHQVACWIIECDAFQSVTSPSPTSCRGQT